MKVINLDIEKIKPYENNPRHNENAINTVAKSIEEFGFQQPLVLDKDNIIVVGHTRYKAALKLGIKEVPCVIANNLTVEQCKAYRLADNKVGELAEWDFELLNQELEEIEEIEMSNFGFHEKDYDENDIDLSSFFEDENEKETEEKEIQCPHCGEWFKK